MGPIDRVASWPSSKSTFALAACMAAYCSLDVATGDVGWTFWGAAVVGLLLLAAGIRELRAGH
jgi:hypothetical protein